VLKGAIALQEIGGRHGHPKLKELVVEASRALSRLDADRLEELALSCQALNRALVHEDAEAHAALAAEAMGATGDMAVFARVLEATRANLNVMNRLRELRAGRLEYREGRMETGASQASEWRRTGSGHGDN
jgi:aminopeptidase N